MKNIFRIFRSDLYAITHHFFAFVIIIAISILPALYAWFNIYANHDPYGNTGNIKIAVASNDPGTTLDDGSYVNMADEVLEELHESDAIDWQFPDTVQEAIDGVYAGKYYAAIVFEENFTYNMYHFEQALVSKDAPMTYYENGKKNAIASKITDTAASNLNETINTKYLKVLITTIFKQANGLNDSIESGEVTQAALDQLMDLRDTLNDYSTALGQFVASGDALDSSLSSAQGALNNISLPDGSNLTEAQVALLRAQQTIDAFGGGVDSKLAEVQTALDDAAAAISVLEQNTTITDAIESQLDNAITKVQTLESHLQALRGLFPESSTIAGSQYVIDTLDALITRAQSIEDALNTLHRSGNLSMVSSAASDMSSTIGSMRTLVTNNLTAGFDTLLQNLRDVLNSVSPLLSTLSVTLDDVDPVIGSAKETVNSVDQSLSRLQSLLDTLSAKLTNLIVRVENSSPDEKLQTLIDVLGGDAEQYGGFFSSLVDVSVQEVYPVNSYGTAMAPFYTTLALWVGGVIMGAILKVHADPLKFPTATTTELFFGRFLIFLFVGQLQAAVIALGDMYLLGCVAVHPWLFWGACAVASVVFTTLIYALSISFGDVGKAIVVVIMVVQIAGSSGSYPIEILPVSFNKIYLFFPFPYAINAMREAICGVYRYDYLKYIAELLIFGVIGLVIGLFVRRPFIGMNEFVEEKLEETELI